MGENVELFPAGIRAKVRGLQVHGAGVEEALAAAGQEDYQPLQRLLSVLARPYDDTPEQTPYRSPAPPSDQPYRTFCGT